MIHESATRPCLLCGVAIAWATAGCAEAPEEVSLEQIQADTRVAPDAGVIVAWNEIAFENAAMVDGHADLFPHLRALAMMHLAMHDAVNAVRARYAHYAFQAWTPWADASLAAASAAHAVLRALYPANEAFLDERLEPFVSARASGPRRAARALGAAAADAILNLRSGDGSEEAGSYTPGSDPGSYQFVPPFDFIYRPAWRYVPPFGLASVEQFRSEPPPALDSAEYAADYAEVRSYGRASDSTRSEDQTFYADWWYELSEIGWNRIARVSWEAAPLDLWDSARAFAVLNVSLMDGYLAGWDSKLHYDFWRPYTAIRAGDSDGNDATEAEPTWEPYCVTPPIQDYPSTHSVLGAAGAEVLSAVFGTEVGFSMASSSSNPPGQTRALPSFAAAALENADSRVACGIHFRFATRAGLELGAQIGAYVLDTLLRPRQHHR